MVAGIRKSLSLTEQLREVQMRIAHSMVRALGKQPVGAKCALARSVSASPRAVPSSSVPTRSRMVPSDSISLMGVLLPGLFSLNEPSESLLCRGAAKGTLKWSQTRFRLPESHHR